MPRLSPCPTHFSSRPSGKDRSPSAYLRGNMSVRRINELPDSIEWKTRIAIRPDFEPRHQIPSTDQPFKSHFSRVVSVRGNTDFPDVPEPCSHMRPRESGSVRVAR